MPPATRRRIALLLPATAALSACAGGLWPSPTPLPTRYTWASPSPQVEHLQPGRPVLLLAPPTAAPELQGTELLYLGPNGALQPYAYSSWSAPPAQALPALLQPALAASGAFVAVLLSPSAARPQLRLETHLGRLQHEPSRGEMLVQLNAVLINLTTRQPLGSRSFMLRQPVAQAQAASAVAAAQTLGQRLAAEVALWCANLL
jgi:ABC-type uncharacterized transport system auxiliary subunit